MEEPMPPMCPSLISPLEKGGGGSGGGGGSSSSSSGSSSQQGQGPQGRRSVLGAAPHPGPTPAVAPGKQGETRAVEKSVAIGLGPVALWSPGAEDQ